MQTIGPPLAAGPDRVTRTYDGLLREGEGEQGGVCIERGKIDPWTSTVETV